LLATSRYLPFVFPFAFLYVQFGGHLPAKAGAVAENTNTARIMTLKEILTTRRM
jgi:hypothetical protein